MADMHGSSGTYSQYSVPVILGGDGSSGTCSVPVILGSDG